MKSQEAFFWSDGPGKAGGENVLVAVCHKESAQNSFH